MGVCVYCSKGRSLNVANFIIPDRVQSAYQNNRLYPKRYNTYREAIKLYPIRCKNSQIISKFVKLKHIIMSLIFIVGVFVLFICSKIWFSSPQNIGKYGEKRVAIKLDWLSKEYITLNDI